jgi:hypothetical protein
MVARELLGVKVVIVQHLFSAEVKNWQNFSSTQSWHMLNLPLNF